MTADIAREAASIYPKFICDLIEKKWADIRSKDMGAMDRIFSYRMRLTVSKTELDDVAWRIFAALVARHGCFCNARVVFTVLCISGGCLTIKPLAENLLKRDGKSSFVSGLFDLERKKERFDGLWKVSDSMLLLVSCLA
jgi:hypothetical protein